MINDVFKGFIKAKFNLAILLALIVGAVADFYETYAFKADLINQLANPAVDLNIKTAEKLVKGTNGLSYIGNYVFSSTSFILTLVLLLLGLSAVIGDATHKNLRSGLGNMMVLRSGYDTYIRNMIVAECKYITIFVWGYFISLTVVAMIIWPPAAINIPITSSVPIPNSVIGTLIYFCIHMLLLNVYLCLLFTITALSTVAFNNKYILLALPLVLHFVPMLLASTVGNINAFFARALTIANPQTYLFSVTTSLNTSTSISEILVTAIGIPAILLIIGMIMYRWNHAKYQREYL